MLKQRSSWPVGDQVVGDLEELAGRSGTSGGVGGGVGVWNLFNSFYVLKNMFFLPLLVLKGMYHYFFVVFFGFYLPTSTLQGRSICTQSGLHKRTAGTNGPPLEGAGKLFFSFCIFLNLILPCWLWRECITTGNMFYLSGFSKWKIQLAEFRCVSPAMMQDFHGEHFFASRWFRVCMAPICCKEYLFNFPCWH